VQVTSDKTTMNTILQGRVTKRHSCNKCLLLEGVNFILRKQVEQKSWKLFTLNEQKRQMEQYCEYLEDIVNNTHSSPETDLEKKSERHEGENETVLMSETKEIPDEENDRYWKCFWCLKESGTSGVLYENHLENCRGRRVFERSYQQESLNCSECSGVKIEYQPCLPVYATPFFLCKLCDKKICRRRDIVKDVNNHYKYNLIICSCEDIQLFADKEIMKIRQFKEISR